jgi:hypothetical protein
VNNSARIIKLYGITKYPKKNDFMMVMEYADDGDLRQKIRQRFQFIELEE